MLWLYNAICTLLWPLVWLYPPFKGTVRARLGRFDLTGYNPAAPGPKLLINAVSAGEVVAIAPLIRELKSRQPAAQIVLLTTTDSGQTMAKEKLGDALSLLLYFPLADLHFVSKRYLERLRPDVYITTEAELWPNIQSQCRARGIPVVLANARLYLHNKRGLRGWAVRKLYLLCDMILCQDERQRQNFLTFGLPPEMLSATGNMKFDFAMPEWSDDQLQLWRGKWGAASKVIVAGSTHPGEEAQLLESFSALRAAHESPQLIIAPRHIERASEAAELARKQGFTAATLSEHESNPATWDVLIVERYGVLVDFYRLADIVVMGGTFHQKVGGHNILEATVLGKPVVVGPHTFSITAQLELLLADAAIVRSDEGSGALEQVLQSLLADPAAAAQIGERARLLTLANRGAAARAADSVLALLSRHT